MATRRRQRTPRVNFRIGVRDTHQGWYAEIADHYPMLYAPDRDAKAAEFLYSQFRRHGPVRDVLDVACGTFGIGVGLVRRGYRVVGRDASKEMLKVARKNLRGVGNPADLAEADMRTLRFARQFDAIVCLGTAFNYLVTMDDVRRTLRSFYAMLKRGGLLVLDLTNFEAFIDNPMNARAHVDYRAPSGMRIAIFTFDEQNRSKTIHIARFLTVLHRGSTIDVRWDEAPLRIWRKEGIARTLRRHRYRPIEWWGDLVRGVPYHRKASPRLVVLAART